MTFVEFGKWCNERACDGLWGIEVAIFCSDLYISILKASPLKRKREKLWGQNEHRETAENVVVEINKMIAKMDEVSE